MSIKLDKLEYLKLPIGFTLKCSQIFVNSQRKAKKPPNRSYWIIENKVVDFFVPTWLFAFHLMEFVRGWYWSCQDEWKGYKVGRGFGGLTDERLLSTSERILFIKITTRSSFHLQMEPGAERADWLHSSTCDTCSFFFALSAFFMPQYHVFLCGFCSTRKDLFWFDDCRSVSFTVL